MNAIPIGKLSIATDVNIETIRYYEREGVLPLPKRSENGRRIYYDEDVRRLNFIHKCRRLGFSLKEIRGLLSLVDTGDFTCGEIHGLTIEHANQVAEKIEDLRRMQEVLLEMAAHCSKGKVPECPIIDSLYK